MNRIQRLQELLKDTNSAVERLSSLAAENPTDTVIVSNFAAIRKRKSDLERRLAGELESTQSDEAESAQPTSLAAFPGLWEAPSAQVYENIRYWFNASNGSVANPARLGRLHPLLRSLCSELTETLNASNLPYGHLRERTRAYHALISKNLADIDFSVLFLEGIRLENAVRALEETEIGPLDDHVLESIKSVLTLHVAFLKASAEGSALLEATNDTQYPRPKYWRLFQDANGLASVEKGLAEIAEEIRRVAKETELERGSTRSFLIEVAHDVTITFSASMLLVSLSALLSGSTELGLIAGTFGAALVALMIKRSKSLRSLFDDKVRRDR